MKDETTNQEPFGGDDRTDADSGEVTSDAGGQLVGGFHVGQVVFCLSHYRKRYTRGKVVGAALEASLRKTHVLVQFDAWTYDCSVEYLTIYGPAWKQRKEQHGIDASNHHIEDDGSWEVTEDCRDGASCARAVEPPEVQKVGRSPCGQVCEYHVCSGGCPAPFQRVLKNDSDGDCLAILHALVSFSMLLNTFWHF